MLYVETDGTGVPMRPSETAGRDGKGGDGTAGTHEVRLARFFTVSRLDRDGRPVMDPGSSSYVATLDGKDTLAGLVEAEYLRRGGERHRQVVAIGDGDGRAEQDHLQQSCRAPGAGDRLPEYHWQVIDSW
jgi:hypothetical protein